jgi:hypothetical protein
VVPALITSARIPKSLDADQRMHRYLASMAVRVACFITGCFAPFPFNIALFVGAAVIPGVAVILANAIDLRTPPPESVATGHVDGPALTTGEVVQGDVEGGAEAGGGPR